MKIVMFIILISDFGAFLHPIKMSFSKMSFDMDGKAAIETRLFRDDLTLHIENKYRLKDADFSTISSNGSQALQQYIDECLHIVQAGHSIGFVVKGISLSEDKAALIVDMESNGIVERNKVYEIKNVLLFDVFKKQKNLLIIEDKTYNKFFFSQDAPIQLVTQ